MNGPNVFVMANSVYYASQKCMESLRTVLDAQLFPSNMNVTLGNYPCPQFSVSLFSNCSEGVPV